MSLIFRKSIELRTGELGLTRRLLRTLFVATFCGLQARSQASTVSTDPVVVLPNSMETPTQDLALTHNCLRVHHPEQLAEFYTKKFGMKVLGNLETDSGEQWYYLGFADHPGVLWNPNKTYLELHHNPTTQDPVQVKSSRNETYWKIGVTTPDVNEAASRLRAAGVQVENGSQFLDIGFLTHLADPDGFGIELLQHDFERNFVRGTPSADLPLGFPATLGQITLRISDADASLNFYRDQLGMKLLSRQEVSRYGFVLYFLAWTDEQPPNADVDAVENREWLWKRPYTTLELQHIAGHPGYRAPAANEAGFLGMRAHSSNIRGLKSHLTSAGVTIVNSSDDDHPFGLPSFEIRDPDGVPIFFNQIAL